MEKVEKLVEELLVVLDKYRKDRVQPPNVGEKIGPKVGEWWWSNDFNARYLMLYKEITDTGNHRASVYFCGNQFTSSNGLFSTLDCKATDEEVLSAFTTYFRSQGFKEGSRFKSAATCSEFIYAEPLTIDGLGNIKSDRNGLLFKSATLTLATLIEDEKIIVGDEEVKFGDHGSVIFNGFFFDKRDIERLMPINPELFQKILDRLKSK